MDGPRDKFHVLVPERRVEPRIQHEALPPHGIGRGHGLLQIGAIAEHRVDVRKGALTRGLVLWRARSVDARPPEPLLRHPEKPSARHVVPDAVSKLRSLGRRVVALALREDPARFALVDNDMTSGVCQLGDQLRR
jgi:hypothetical protein